MFFHAEKIIFWRRCNSEERANTKEKLVEIEARHNDVPAAERGYTAVITQAVTAKILVGELIDSHAAAKFMVENLPNNSCISKKEKNNSKKHN